MSGARGGAIARTAAAQPLIESAMVEQQSQRVAIEAERLATRAIPIRVTICDGARRVVEDVGPAEEICYDPDPGDDVHVGPLWSVQRDAAVVLVWFRRDGRSVPGVVESRLDTRLRAAILAEREACAMVAQTAPFSGRTTVEQHAAHIAASIRARSHP